MNEKLDARIMIRIGSDLLAALEKEAARQARKPSALARLLIEDGLKSSSEGNGYAIPAQPESMIQEV